MQSQQPCSGALSAALKNGAAILLVTANTTVRRVIDYIKATGGAGGITITLTPGIDASADPTNPIFLYQVYHARKDDAAAGAITFVDLNGALFNRQPSWVLNNQDQWAIFIWNGTGWDVFGN